MKIRLFKTQQEALKFAYVLMSKGRHVRMHRTPNGRFEVRALAREQK